MPDDVHSIWKPTPLSRGDWAWCIALSLTALLIMGRSATVVRPGYLSYSDCIPYIVQAHIFREGHLSRPVLDRSISPHFETNNMVEWQGREFSRQPPGAPAIFAALMGLLGDIRLVPPLLTAAAIACGFLWIRRLYDRSTAVLTCLLLVLNYVYLQLGASLISYSPSGLLLAGAMLCMVSAIEKGTLIPAGLAGLCIGVQFATRPFSAILSALGLVIVRAVVYRNRPGMFKQGLFFAGGLLPGIAAFLLHNHAITGQYWPLAFTINAPLDRIGFGLRGLGPTTVNHTPIKAVRNLVGTMYSLGAYSFGFGLWFVPMVLWMLRCGLQRLRHNRQPSDPRDQAMWIMFGAFALGHMLYWYPRAINYYEAFSFLSVLVARGILHTASMGRGWRKVAIACVVLPCVLRLPFVGNSLLKPSADVSCLYPAIDECLKKNGPLLVLIAGAECLDGEITLQTQNDPASLGLFNTSLSDDHPVLFAARPDLAGPALKMKFPNRRLYVVCARPSRDPKLCPFEVELIPLEQYHSSTWQVPNPRPDR